MAIELDFSNIMKVGLLVKTRNSINYQSNGNCYSPQIYWPNFSKEMCFSLREVVIYLFPTFCLRDSLLFQGKSTLVWSQSIRRHFIPWDSSMEKFFMGLSFNRISIQPY